MSPQFVDFDHDGRLDILAGTFDGSPHIARGTDKGFGKPEQILDRDGQRIVMNQFWNFDTARWEETDRCNPAVALPTKGHLTSAWAIDVGGDGDFDLLLGDHAGGYVYLRTNEGTPQLAAFATKNELMEACYEPLQVPGTVTTMQVVDWDLDGNPDLVCGGMGDAYGNDPGGGIYSYHNAGTAMAPRYDARTTLVPPSKKAEASPTRPDSGLYMHVVDFDGDGDLDLLVGGYSHWNPPTPALTGAQSARVEELQQEQSALAAESRKLNVAVTDATKDLDADAVKAKRKEILEQQSAERKRIDARSTEVRRELEPLTPGQKRDSFVWLYENRAGRPAPVR